MPLRFSQWRGTGTDTLLVVQDFFRDTARELGESSLYLFSPENARASNLKGSDGDGAHLVVDPSRRVSAKDLEVLLEHFYHEM